MSAFWETARNTLYIKELEMVSAFASIQTSCQATIAATLNLAFLLFLSDQNLNRGHEVLNAQDQDQHQDQDQIKPKQWQSR